MRAFWIAQHMGARVSPLNDSPELEDADTIIWQKIVDVGFIREHPELCHYWDVCDPMWWWSPQPSRDTAGLMTGIVASNQALADDFNLWYGEQKAICIPDRLDLSHFPIQRQHVDASPVRLIWFGMSVNRIALFAALVNVERLVANGYRIELTLCDDSPDKPLQITDMFPFYHVRWELNTENKIIAAHDLALLPPYPGPWGQVKSNNKHLTAWACGVPSVDGQDYAELERAVQSVTWRSEMSRLMRLEVEKQWAVERSAEEWTRLLFA